MSDLIKLPVEVLKQKAPFGEDRVFVIEQDSDGSICRARSIPIAEFIATAINSYEANQARIKELEADKAELTANIAKELDELISDAKRGEKLTAVENWIERVLEDK